ncbi:hypothetical protein DB313_05440 (plasmid) [Borrelia turcica IST7]|uniref:Uncharacterized protein n=1 Tax=Borrelia turcica IST7 TaxID=1104446 RepID=A0A386PPV0_9SPIR|nr:hypothetical protein DB313_05440 [Borrelia turcica IST7]
MFNVEFLFNLNEDNPAVIKVGDIIKIYCKQFDTKGYGLQIYIYYVRLSMSTNGDRQQKWGFTADYTLYLVSKSNFYNREFTKK